MENSVSIPAVHIDLLEEAFTSQCYPALFDGKETHTSALKLVGQLVRHTRDVDLIGRIVRSGLPPDYSGNTLEEVPRMVQGALDQGFGKAQTVKPARPRKPAAADILMEMIATSGAEFFHDDRKRGFISVPLESGGRVNMALRSQAARMWFRHLIYGRSGASITAQALQNCVDTLEAAAFHDWPLEQACLRVGKHGDCIYFDLGRQDGRVVQVDAVGWTLTYDCPVRFYRPDGFGELPLPVAGKIQGLRDVLQLDDRNWSLVLAFLLNCLRPDGPYMCLVVEGEQGSGKSLLSEFIKKLVDPSALMKTRLPESDRDLMVLAQEMHLPVFDNVSGMKNDMSDALCSLATGGGYGKRKNYTDDELFIFSFARPFTLNGIADFVHRPDLLDRALPIQLEAITQGKRRVEAEIRAEFGVGLPGYLGSLFDGVSSALRLSATTKAPADIRMVDAAKWILAAAPGCGADPEQLLAAMMGAQSELVIERINNDPVAMAIVSMLNKGPIIGLISEVFASAKGGWGERTKFMPETPQHFSRYLSRLSPGLRRIGVFVEFVERTRRGRVIKIWMTGQEHMTAKNLGDPDPNPRPGF